MSARKTERKAAPSPRGSAKPLFLVKLMRPIFQTTVIAVEAVNEQSAILLAKRGAARLDTRKWLGSFEPKNYGYDVQHIVDANEALENRGKNADPHTAIERLAHEVRSYDDCRYLVLKADVEFGEGALVPQRWLWKQSDLMVADLAGDWIAELEPIGARRLDRRLERTKAPSGKDEGAAAVVSIRHPAVRDEPKDD